MMSTDAFLHLLEEEAGERTLGGGFKRCSDLRSELSEYTTWVQSEFAAGRFGRVNSVYIVWLDDTTEGFEVGGRQYNQLKPRLLVEFVDIAVPEACCPVKSPLPRIYADNPALVAIKAGETRAAPQGDLPIQSHWSGDFELGD